MTDGLEQHHRLERELPCVINANCRAHARRDYADAVKAIEKSDTERVKNSIAYQALTRISTIYKLEGTLKELTAQERLRERESSSKPLVEEYFAWVKERVADITCLPKGKNATGLKYSLNQEKYLKIFLPPSMKKDSLNPQSWNCCSPGPKSFQINVIKRAARMQCFLFWVAHDLTFTQKKK